MASSMEREVVDWSGVRLLSQRRTGADDDDGGGRRIEVGLSKESVEERGVTSASSLSMRRIRR